MSKSGAYHQDVFYDAFTDICRMLLALVSILSAQAITPTAAISQIPGSPSALRIGGGTNTTPPSTATGNVYYVSTTGNDSGPGTQTQPFRSISKAYSRT